jgi:hypothetical protein
MAMKFRSRMSRILVCIAPAMLLTVAYAGKAQADPVLGPIPCAATASYTYSLQLNTSIGSPAPTIEASGPSSVNWSATQPAVGACSIIGTTTWGCAGMTVTFPGNPAPLAQKVTITTAAAVTSLGSESLDIKATNPPAAAEFCAGNFTFRVTSTGGGWGDPHLTTVDGVHYDFQSAGEFTALREEGLVIQTRQGAVPTATVPITNPYTGITHCVSIYTAVAAKLGSTRVTVQPSPGAEPDPKSMQLRVNGKLVTLGEAPLILRAEGDAGPAAGSGGRVDGTLTRHRDGNLEITDARGTQLVVTPSYWASQKVWYLNVNVYGTSAHEGTMGSIPKGSWLPALPDGTSVGAKPESESDRYQALYEKFADAWRVTDANSLFDYEPGTNTATFTRDEWPRNHPQSCAIEGQTSVQSVTEQTAQQACAAVTDATQKADCVFDVMITGNTGFAKSYELMRRFGPRTAGWYTPVPPQAPTPTPPTPPSTPKPPAWCCWLAFVLGIVLLMLLAFLSIRSRRKKP